MESLVAPFTLGPLLTAWVAYAAAAAAPGPNMFAVTQSALAQGAGCGLAVAAGIAAAAGGWMTLSALGIASLSTVAPQAVQAVYIFGGGWLLYLGLPAVASGLRAMAARRGPPKAYRDKGQPARAEVRSPDSSPDSSPDPSSDPSPDPGPAPANAVTPTEPVGRFGLPGWFGWIKRFGRSGLPVRGGLGRAFLRGVAVSLTNPKGLLFFVSVASLAGEAGRSPVALALLVVVTTCLSMTIYGAWAVCFSRPFFRGHYHRFENLLNLAFGLIFAGFGLALWGRLAVRLV